MRPRQLTPVAVAAVVALSFACSNEEAKKPSDPEFARLVSQDIEDARAAGASEAQIAILEEAKQTGEIAFDSYNESVERSLRCMREVGVDVVDDGIVRQIGVQLRVYSVPADAEEADPREPVPGVTVHRCIAEHSFWVETVYQSQPSSVEAQEAHFEQHRQAILDCLADHGIEVDPDVSEHELALQLSQDAEERNVHGLCLAESGYLQR